MNTRYQHIRQLYLEKLTGTISEEDDARLQDLLHESAEVRSIWELLEQERRELNAEVVLARIDPENELEEWKKRTGRRALHEKQFTLWKWPAAAAIVAGLGIGYLFWNNSAHTPPVGVSVSDNHDQAVTGGVKLILGDGKSVVFRNDKAEKLSIEGMQIESSGGQLQYEGNERQASVLNTLAVPAKEDYGITLSDGTRISLNSQTTMRFPFYFNGDTREVYIEGEAYLEVAKDNKRPFVVHTPLADIHVTGTRFNVNTYDEGTVRTSLVEGSVSVRAGDKKPLELVPGLEALYSQHKGFTTARFDPGEVLSWREGVFYFHSRQLGELTGLISRWFDVRVVFEREQLIQYTVSGLMEKGRLTEFLDDLHATSGVEYTIKDNVLYLK